MILTFIGSFILFIVLLFEYTVSYPWHASCQIQWTIPTTCDDVRTKLTNQMNEWQGDANCGTVSDECPSLPCGQLCLYEFVSQKPDGSELKGLHKTPAKRYIDDMTFTFNQNENSCSVEAYSTSRTWYAILDWGTNYCNLRNLLDGSQLSRLNGFEEATSTSVCTQYDAINCARY